MPRLRISLRCLMVAVLVAGIAFWAIRLTRLSSRYREQAAHHSNELMYVWNICCFDDLKTEASRRRHAEHLAFSRRREADHVALKAKYDRASRYPWLSLVPDPPMPE